MQTQCSHRVEKDRWHERRRPDLNGKAEIVRSKSEREKRKFNDEHIQIKPMCFSNNKFIIHFTRNTSIYMEIK